MTTVDLNDDTPNQKRRKINKVVIYVDPDADSDDLQSSNKDNIYYIKHDVKEMMDYRGNTTEYHPDGMIEITPNYLKPIPNEIIEIIINYLLEHHAVKESVQLEQQDLYQLTLVSKQFYHQTNHILWHSPYIPNADILQRFQNCLAIARLTQSRTSFSDALDNHNYGIVNNIIMPRHHVRRLSLDGDHWDDVQFTLMVPHFNLLEELTITNTGNRISVASLQNFPRYFPHLTVLSLRVNQLSQNCMDAIGQHCEQLCDLELPLNTLPPNTFKALVDNHCSTTNLQVFRFHYPDSSSSHTGDDSISVDMIKDMTQFDCLEELEFTGRKCPSTLNLILTATTSKGTPAWPSLTSLYIENGDRLDEPSFISFIKSHPSLDYIHLGRCLLSDSTLDTMTGHLPNLYNLSMQHNPNITANAVYRLVQRCQHLEAAGFSGCTTLFSSMPELSKDKFQLTLDDFVNIRQRDAQ